MNHYSPMSRSERAAVAVVSGTVSLSLVAGLLVLFNDGRLPSLGSDPPSVLAAGPQGQVATTVAQSQAHSDRDDTTASVASR